MNRRNISWLREALRNAQKLSIYNAGESVESLARRLNLKPSEILRLNANEDFFLPLSLLRSLMREVAEELDPRMYPHGERLLLEEALGRYLKISSEQVVVGAGGDQLIELIAYAFLRKGDTVLSIAPTFSIYERVTRVLGAEYLAVPLRENFSLDTGQMLTSSTKAKMLFLCSPNNPTANQFKLEDVLRLAEEFEGLVIVDEAYVEFAPYSTVHLAEKLDNLIVLRTFSKAFGLAGLRLGYAVSNREISPTLNERFQMPYPASLTALRLALKLLERVDLVEAANEELKRERDRFIKRLNEVKGVHAFDSDANFVLISLDKSSDEVYEKLLRRGAIVRNIGRVLNKKNCLRVTVAPPAISDRFIEIMEEAIK